MIYEAMSISLACDIGPVAKLCRKTVCRLYLYVAILVLAFPFVAYGDELAASANKSYAEISLPEYNLLRWHIAETQGGYIIAGSAYDDSGPRQSALMVKTDRVGKALWKYVFDGGRSSAFHKAVTVEGGVVLAGDVTETVGGPSEEAFGIVVKLKPDGAVEWDSRIKLGRVTRVMDVATNRNDMVAVGRLRRGEYDDAGFIAGIDREGKLLWTKEHGRWLDFVYPLKAGFLAGNSGWLARFDRNGNMLWERNLRNLLGYDCVAAVAELDDGDLVVTGRTGRHPSIGRLTSDGELAWVKEIKIPGACDVLALRQHGKGLRIIGATCKTEPKRLWGASITTSGEINAVRKYLADDGGIGPAAQALMTEGDTFVAFGLAGEASNASIWIFESSFRFESVNER